MRISRFRRTLCEPVSRNLKRCQHFQSHVLNVQIHCDCLICQILCEGVLEVHRESEQFDRYGCEQIHCQQPVKERQYLFFDVQPSHCLILDSRIKYGNNKSCNEESPTEQIEKMQCCFYPPEVKQIRADLRHQCEEIGKSFVNHRIDERHEFSPD